MNRDLLIKAESLKNMLVSRATGGFPENNEYQHLRQEIISVPRIRAKLPRFVESCRSLDEFWGFIKPRFAHYAERRDFLREEFDPLLTMLESETQMPGDEIASAALLVVDSAHVQEAWRKALERRATDPEGAITAARTLLESVCKHILDEAGASYDGTDDLPMLYRKAAKQINLAPDQHSEQLFKQILTGCYTTVQGLGALRNQLSDAHGKGKTGARPAARHAELAVNLAGAMATFLIRTEEARHHKGLKSA